MNIGGINILYYAAAATTAIAGILHLSLVPNVIGRNPNSGIFFIISGIAQIFWVIPMLKRWGRIWYFIGIGGTLILIIMWVITRIPENPITGRGGPISEMAIVIEIFQIAYIIITAIIILKERRGHIKEIVKGKAE
ncbi:MAG: hypothetical protein WBW34_10685 [Nitrososphaeraceae archaeon]